MKSLETNPVEMWNLNARSLTQRLSLSFTKVRKKLFKGKTTMFLCLWVVFRPLSSQYVNWCKDGPRNQKQLRRSEISVEFVKESHHLLYAQIEMAKVPS